MFGFFFEILDDDKVELGQLGGLVAEMGQVPFHAPKCNLPVSLAGHIGGN